MTRTALALAAILASAPAFAADLPGRYAPAAPYYEPTPIFTWTGLYAGLNGQLGLGQYTAGGKQLFGSPVGGLGGGTIGYNYQSGKLVVGAEADIGFGSLSDNSSLGGANGTGTINTLGTARVRVGYAMGQALFYLTGGYAGTSLNGKATDASARPNLMLGESHYLSGFAVGGGLEYALTTKISVKGEYLFTGFNSERYFTGTRDAISAGANVSLIRAGVNYHF